MTVNSRDATLQTPPEIKDAEGLFAELESARTREKATRRILDLLLRSREDHLPVFDAILKDATEICSAPIAAMVMIDSERTQYSIVASRGATPEFVDAMELAVWEKDGSNLYLRISWEDRELPIFISMGVEGCEPNHDLF